MIKRIRAWKILDSRGRPTVSVLVETDKASAYAAAPSGASTGAHEVVAFPKSVDDAVKFVNNDISKALCGKGELNQKMVDDILHEIDGTPNFAKIGGNTAIAVSMAVMKAAAAGSGKELAYFINPKAKKFPYPLGNAVGGGAHGGGTDIQEFLLIPFGAKTYPEAAFENAHMHSLLKDKLKVADDNFLTSRNDEGGWVTGLKAAEILDLMSRVIDEVDSDAKIGLDLASTQLFDGENYNYNKEGLIMSPGEQIDYLADLVKTYPIAYLEDPLQEEDFLGFAELNEKVDCMVCADDLTVTNNVRLLQAIELKSCNTMIVKPNQIGTLSETLNVVETAKENDIATAISHRSGETTDATIAHLALATESLLLKTGIVGGERVAKHNELIRLWKDENEMVKQ